MNSEAIKGNPSQNQEEFPKLIKTKDCDGNCAAGLFCNHYIKYLENNAKAEQIKIDAEIFRKETEGICHAACNKPLYLGVIYEKILNQNSL